MALVLLAAALLASKAVQPPPQSTVVVRATDDIFAAGYGGMLKRDLGTTPTAIPVTPGETLELTADGKVGCCGVAQVKVDAAGYPRNPFSDTGSHIANPLRTQVSSFVDPSAVFMLVGVFDDRPISNNDVFEIGKHKTFTVPPNATHLYLGFADATGFTGPAGSYGDNKGSLTVTIQRSRLR